MTRLGSDLSTAQKEMKSKHKAYESAVSILSRRLQEALTAKEAAEAELSQLRAQAADGASSLTLNVRTSSVLARHSFSGWEHAGLRACPLTPL